MKYRVVIKDPTGTIVASEEGFETPGQAQSYGQQSIQSIGSQTQETAKTLIMANPSGALFTGMALKVDSTVEEALSRVEAAITGANPLPRISDTGKGDTATGVWDGKAGTLYPVSFRSIGGSPQQATSAISNAYEELGSARKIFGAVGKLEMNGEPLGDVLYAPIVEPEDPDTSGFIMG